MDAMTVRVKDPRLVCCPAHSAPKLAAPISQRVPHASCLEKGRCLSALLSSTQLLVPADFHWPAFALTYLCYAALHVLASLHTGQSTQLLSVPLFSCACLSSSCCKNASRWCKTSPNHSADSAAEQSDRRFARRASCSV